MEKYLNTSAAECRKNPGHEQFTLTSLFKPSHLPDSFSSQLVWALICHKARLAVRLFVKDISNERPPQFQQEYSKSITGSGYVTCIDRSNPGHVTISIETAAHIVFNDEEAKSTIAKFFFNRSQQLFQIQHARLLDVNQRKDRSEIVFTIDLETLPCLVSPNDLSALEYALSPSVLPDVNNNMNISLLQTVVVKYKTTSVTWLSFLFNEIKCLRNIKFISNETRSLEIEINMSHILLYDIILLIIALASHHDLLMNFMEDVVRRNDVNVDTVHRPYITMTKTIVNRDISINSDSKSSLHQFINTDNGPICVVDIDFTIMQNARLYQLMICLVKAPDEMVELNNAVKHFCGFDISARLKRSDVIVFEISMASVNIPDIISLDINLHDVMLEENYDHAAVLISHPHDDMPQQITVGHLDHLPGHSEISYTTPSCPGSSGGAVYIIPRAHTSLEELEKIYVITHSCATSDRGFGN